MTRNQVAYQNYLETSRANRASEEQRRNELQETKRSNVARESENIRSNLEKERENYRANTAREGETHRSNLANELESQRANRAREAENYRSNRANEAIESSKLAESIRSNMARETETHRSNLSNEGLKRAELGETNRHNLATESLSRLQMQNALQVARIGAEARISSATISANTARQNAHEAAVVSKYNAQLQSQTNQNIASRKNMNDLLINQSKVDIANRDRHSREEISRKDRLQRYIDSGIRGANGLMKNIVDIIPF